MGKRKGKVPLSELEQLFITGLDKDYQVFMLHSTTATHVYKIRVY